MPHSHGLFARCLVSLLIAGTLVGVPAWADPTAEQQYWLELLNRARRDPAGELERLVNYSSPTTFAPTKSDDTDVINALNFFNVNASALATQWASLVPAPALAWNDSLANTAHTYSQLMVTEDQQSHTLDGLTELELNQRVEAGGYSADYLDVGENLFTASKSAFYGHAAFLIDWGDEDSNPGNGYGTGIQSPASHRDVSLDPAFKEIGIGIVSSGIPGSNQIATGPQVVTQHLANHFRMSGSDFVVDSILTGVVYSDALLGDDFYTPGEGISGTVIEVYDDGTNSLLFTGLTNTAGGFNIAMPGAVIGDVLRIAAPGTGLGDQFITLTGYTTDGSVYGVPVTFFDNAYASFQLAPEPSTLMLCCGLGVLSRRRRPRWT